MAGDMVEVYVAGETGNEKLTVGVHQDYGIEVYNRDGTPRDMTSDTLSVTAKLDTTSKTLVFAADANQTTTGKGKATLSIPAAQIGSAGTLYVHLLLAKSGGSANIIKRLQWPVEADVTA